MRGLLSLWCLFVLAFERRPREWRVKQLWRLFHGRQVVGSGGFFFKKKRIFPERLDVCMYGKKRFNSNLRSISARTPPCARPQAIPCISSLYHRIRNTKDQLASACGSFGRKLF